MEASGTGNMKMALNGALTIGTLDGANIEIRDAVGADNIFIFGLLADEVAELRQAARDGHRAIIPSATLNEVLAMIETGVFSPGDRDRFQLLTQALRHADHYMIVADFDAYWRAQRAADALWRDPDAWAAACARNIAGMAWFSADRAIGEYAKTVWHARF
jgi:starch phosphorylase